MEQTGNDLFDEVDDGTAEARAEYSEIRAELSTRILGREDLVSRLALVTYLHRRGTAVQRLLFVGPSGAGKTHVARAIAEVSGAPFFSVDCQQITESGYAGIHLDELLAGFAAQVKAKDPARLCRSVILIDELDKIRVHPQAHGNAMDKPRAVQTSLLGLLGVGAPVRYGAGANDQLDPARLLVICTAAFSQSEFYGQRPSSADLVRYGLMSELVDRLGEVVLVAAPSEAELIQRYREDASTAAGAYRDAAASLGLRLVVLDETYAYVARWVLSGAGGLREGAGKLSEGAARLLARALREGAPAGSTLTLSPDCLEGIRMLARSR